MISPLTVANAHYDAVKDFVAVAPLGNLPNVLVIAPAKNIHTAQELVAAAHKRPVTFGALVEVMQTWSRSTMFSAFSASISCAP